MSLASASTSNSLYFVDASLYDLDTLLAALPAGAEVVLLDSTQDRLTQMLAALNGRNGVDAVHVLTHGAPGQIQLGNTQLNADTLSSVSSTLQALGQHLSADADILFYGCDVGASEEGRALISQIADLTGADVAASTDLTGSSSLGGDWELEAHSGVIEAAGIAAFNFDDTLALPGAHSAAQGSEVFIGGNYNELGISSVGSFGTSGNKPAGFYGTSGSSAVGMSNDADGFNNGNDLRIDSFLERMAVNSPIQGSAADLIKVAMIKVHRRLQHELPRCKMILQVHDELIFEVPDQELEQAKQLVKAEMEATCEALGLSVPLKVDVGVGSNWRVAHP